MNTLLTSDLSNAVIVNNLIHAALKVIPHLSDREEAKVDLIKAIFAFESAIASSAIGIDEIKEYMESHGMAVDDIVAWKLLKDVALDIDFNCVNQAIESHADEYLAACLDKQRK